MVLTTQAAACKYCKKKTGCDCGNRILIDYK